eukprot:TRINITY_DN47771_c0_g1_i1.p1 TRINITY_DN47771_c0_g1~~TRINITY_DN47771_c0_g1_i1.p1  ORF type:complete len:657 (-),score=77.53 TRINITY_DN47771_c0_g1_i1:31-2001(-)
MVLGRAWRGGGAGPLPQSIARAGVGAGQLASHDDDAGAALHVNGGRLPGLDSAAPEDAVHECVGGASSSSSPRQRWQRLREVPPSNGADVAPVANGLSAGLSTSTLTASEAPLGAAQVLQKAASDEENEDERLRQAGEEDATRQAPPGQPTSLQHAATCSGSEVQAASAPSHASPQPAQTQASRPVSPFARTPLAREPVTSGCGTPGRSSGHGQQQQSHQNACGRALSSGGLKRVPARGANDVAALNGSQMRWSFSDVITPRMPGAASTEADSTLSQASGQTSPMTPGMPVPVSATQQLWQLAGSTRPRNSMGGSPAGRATAVSSYTPTGVQLHKVAVKSPRRSLPDMSATPPSTSFPSASTTPQASIPDRVPIASAAQAFTPTISTSSTPQGPFAPPPRAMSPMSARSCVTAQALSSTLRSSGTFGQAAPLGGGSSPGTGTNTPQYGPPATLPPQRLAAHAASLVAPPGAPAVAVAPAVSLVQTPGRYPAVVIPGTSQAHAGRDGASGALTPGPHSKPAFADAAGQNSARSSSVPVSMAPRARVAVDSASAPVQAACGRRPGPGSRVGARQGSKAAQGQPNPGQQTVAGLPGRSGSVPSGPSQAALRRTLWKSGGGKAISSSTTGVQEKDDGLTSMCVKLQHKLGKLSTKKTIAL